jgi:rsbT co-antagonist protein RsbR
VEQSRTPSALSLVSLLTDAAGQLAAVKSFAEMGATVFSIIDQMVAVEYGGFFCVDPLDGRLRLYSSRGFSDEERIEAERTALDRHPGWVIRTGQMLHVPDIDADVEKRTTDSPGHKRKLRSRLFVPVFSSQVCIGAYGLASAEPHYFTDTHIAMLRYAASLTGATYGSLANEQKLSRQLQLLSEKQQELLLLSSPIIEIWERTLALPIIGKIDEERASHMAQTLLSMIVSHRAHTVILDFTGTAALDDRSTLAIQRIVSAVRLLGSRCVFSGVSPLLASSLAMQLGDQALGTEQIRSHATLKQALAMRISPKS